MTNDAEIWLRKSFPAVLLLEALLAGLYFNGNERYLLTLSWLALILWGGYLLSRQQKVEIYIDGAIIALVCFVLWMLFSLLWHPALFYGVIANWNLGIFPFVIFITAYLMREGDIRVSLNLLLGIGLVVGVISVYQSLVLGHAASGFFPNKNNNAAFMNLALLPVISFLLLRDHKGYRRWLASSAFILLFFAVIQATSRGALIALAVTALALLFVAVKKGKTKNILLVFMLVLLDFLLNYWFSSGDRLRTDLESTQVRWYLFSSTVQMIRDSGLFGAGNGMWSHYYPAYRSIQDTSAGFFVHNDYLQLTYELGVPGISFLLAFAVMLSYKFLRIVKCERDMESLALYLGLYAAIAAVSIHSLVTFNFYIVAILIVMGFYVGVILRRASQLSTNRARFHHVEVTGRRVLFGLVFLFMLGKSVILPGYADAMSRGLLGTNITTLEPVQQYRIYSELRVFDPGSAYYPLAAAMTLALVGEDKPLAQREEIFNQCRAIIHEAAAENSFDSSIYVSEAKLLGMYHDVVGESWREEAVVLAARALAMDPATVSTRLLLARLMAEGGDKEMALEIMLERYDHPSNRMMSYYKYGKALAAEVGNDSARKRFTDLIDNYPENYPVW